MIASWLFFVFAFVLCMHLIVSFCSSAFHLGKRKPVAIGHDELDEEEWALEEEDAGFQASDDFG